MSTKTVKGVTTKTITIPKIIPKSLTIEVKVLVSQEMRDEIEKALGLVSLSAWVRDAIRQKLKKAGDEDRDKEVGSPLYQGTIPRD